MARVGRAIGAVVALLTRFAPTPSGYLHLGNAVHLSIVSALAEQSGWQVALRVDDQDVDRVRPEYVDDIFQLLTWLGLSCDVGPTSAAELTRVWSQQQRIELYVQARDELMASAAPVYVCACSRQQWQRHAGVGCPGHCDGLDLGLVAGSTSLRFRWADGADPVVWRREGRPAYHLASVVDDTWLGVTHVVRGDDLQQATQFQRVLATWIPDCTFADAQVVHHRLVLDDDGKKLSKSAGSQAVPLERSEAMRGRIRELTRELLTG